ncbi:MAG: hypothetical protein U9R49_01215 [Bacteroidota bacterium]|nr:hypothetical protein [Bacteroidota bacterium]
MERYHTDSMMAESTNNKIIFGKLLHMNGQKIYPQSHPASLLYNPSYEADTVEKYKKLNVFLKDGAKYPELFAI